MTDPSIRYLGPIPGSSGVKTGSQWLARAPVAFILVVILPTILALVYFLFIASPRYVSEAQFVVRAPAREQPSTLGAALQGVGLSSGSTDSYAVHEYIRSPDGLRDLMRRLDVRAMYARPGVDFASRIPHPFSGESLVAFGKEFNGYVTVGYDSQTGISTLRVEAFTAQDAERINLALLEGGEGLVNKLNARAASDSVAEASQTVLEAQSRLASAQASLTAFRTKERFIDPARTALAGSELVGQLAINLATLRAERAQIAADTPNSPQLALMDSRIRAFESQMAIEQAKIVGTSDSIAPKISLYENLTMEREFADRLLASATAALNSAQLESRRQRLYIDRIVNPTLPDQATEPRRWVSILTILASSLVIYGIGWLIWAGVRESRVHE